MRRLAYIAIFLLFLLNAGKLHAQKFGAGFIAGINASQINGDMMGGFNKTSIMSGIWIDREINEKTGFQFEMIYTRKGSRRVFDDKVVQSGPWDKTRMNYIEVPLMINYHYNKKLMFQGGLTAGYMISSRVTFGGSYLDFTGYKKSEFGFMGGLEYQFTDKFSLNARYSQSLISNTVGNHNFLFSKYSGYINLLLTASARFRFNR